MRPLIVMHEQGIDGLLQELPEPLLALPQSILGPAAGKDLEIKLPSKAPEEWSSEPHRRVDQHSSLSNHVTNYYMAARKVTGSGLPVRRRGAHRGYDVKRQTALWEGPYGG